MLVFEKFSTVFLFFIFWSKCSEADLTTTEMDLTLMLLNHFQGSICVHAFDNSTRELGPARLFSEHGNYFLHLPTINQLENYVTRAQCSEQIIGKSLIVLKAGKNSFTGLKQISQQMRLSSMIWVVYGENPLNKEDFQGIYIPFDCEFVYVNARENIYILTEIYNIRKTSGLEMSNFGFWTKDNGLTIHEERLYRRRKDLKGLTFSAISRSVPPYIIEKEKTPEGTELGGYLYEVWKEIEHRINFRVQFSKGSTDEAENVLDPDSDFAVLPIVYDSSVLDHLDITHPIYESRSYLFGHRPGSELEWDSYLKPFDAQTWWATLAWMIFSSTTLAFLYKISWNYGTSEREAEYFIFTFSESLATVFRSMCNQGSNITPRSNACRLLFLSIYLTALVVNSAFSAALFSLLTVPTARAPFYNFEDVITNKAYRIGSVGDSHLHRILQDYSSKHPNSIQNRLLTKVEHHYETLIQGLNSVCRNKMNIVMSELPFVLFTMQNLTLDCQEKIMPAGPLLLNSFLGFGLKKGSPYKELIDLHLLMMRNDGITQRLLLRSWLSKIPSVQATWVRVTLADISPILYMFGLGAILSAVLLVLEKVKFFMFSKNRPVIAKAKSSVAKLYTSVSGSKTNFTINDHKSDLFRVQTNTLTSTPARECHSRGRDHPLLCPPWAEAGAYPVPPLLQGGEKKRKREIVERARRLGKN